ncbi:MAG TPA: tetratricopeptide repeat protein [Kofleriaceae bacterium]|nr:tetratricopeptide repeat protein [Kofleriaceae bacterium]
MPEASCLVAAGAGSRRKLAVLALGAVGLAGALTVAAFAAPERAARRAATYVPADERRVLARVPARDPEEVAARSALAASPDRVEVAVELARLDLQRYRALSDPRYLGRAQATLARWWKLPDPPDDVLLLRATIHQSIHEFAAARADLDRLVVRSPDAAQAHLTRAVVATVTADYAAARASCAEVARLTQPLVATTCRAPLDGLAGHARDAYDQLAGVLARSRASDPGVRGWALTSLAELALQLGDLDAAERHLRGALALDDGDAYARNLLVDILLDRGDADAARALLDGRETIDSHLVRLAIAAHVAHAPDERRLVGLMRDRIEAAAQRGDRIHLREEARFALVVEHDARRAVALAIDNWAVQKELADARLLAETAAAAHDQAAAAPVLAWARETGVRDAWLDRALGGLR